LAQLVGPRHRHLAAELGKGRCWLRRTLYAAGLLALSLALMQPTWGADVRRVEQRGVDLLVCLDVSRSMLARDVPPSRLQYAQREIRALCERTRGDRLGLVVFAGQARLAVPLTRDMDTFADLVDLTDPLSVGRGGTDLGAALTAALAAFAGQSGAHEAVLLITDGEDHEQGGLRAAEACRQRNITVHCVGIGSPLGSKIVIQSERGEAFLRTRSGEDVVSKLDAAGLRQMAEATGGVFVDAGSAPRPLVELYQTRIQDMARKAVDEGEQRGRKNRFQWPLLVAFVLLLLELATSERRRTPATA
jgi:Ca-activated chloride channel family protein